MLIPIKHSAKQPKSSQLFSLPTSESGRAFGPPACILQGEVPTKNDLYKIARSLGFFTVLGSFHVYVLKCKVAGHWYIGHTNNPYERFREHAGKSHLRGSLFTTRYGFDCPLALFELETRRDAKELELTCFSVFKKQYPDQCFSIGNPCKCTNFTWEAHL
jgi:predicted GIY-YIG superfamily endonuclease